MANQVIVTSNNTIQVAIEPTPNVQVTISRAAVTQIVSNVANANYANFAGNAFAVNIANVVGIGNIASINLDGNVSNLLTGNGTFVTIPVGGANANYANYAGNAFAVDGANVSGFVANANVANTAFAVAGANVSGFVANANVANTAFAVAGANVSGTVANATYAVTSGNSYSVDLANVVGIGNIASINLDGNASNILYGNGVFGPDIGPQDVANANYANYAGNAFAVAGANVSGFVANANVANTALSVDGANVSGTVANANYSVYSGTASSANSVALANVVGIGNIASINLDGNSTNVLYGNGIFNASYSNTDVANYLGNNTVTIANVLSPGNITSNNLITNTSVSSNLINISNGYTINSPGFYFNQGTFATVANANYAMGTPSFFFTGNTTSGSNVISNVTFKDGLNSQTLTSNNFSSYLANQGLGINGLIGSIDTVFPVSTYITSVNSGNSTITVSSNAIATVGAGIQNPFVTGVILSNATNNTYFLLATPYLTYCTATTSSNNYITLGNITALNSAVSAAGANKVPLQFVGTTFGNISNAITYYTNVVDTANSKITVSLTPGGSNVALTTDSGNMYLVSVNNNNGIAPFSANNAYSNIPAINLTGVHNSQGPWPTNPLNFTNLSEFPNVGYLSNAVGAFTSRYNKPMVFDGNAAIFNQQAGTFTRITNGVVVTEDGNYGYPSVDGRPFNSNPNEVVGVTILHTGSNVSANSTRTNFAAVEYAANSSSSANIINPNNPQSLTFTAYENSINDSFANSYIRSGRALGRIAWYGSQIVGNVTTVAAGSSPPAGIYVQALGNWDGANGLPMVFALQYSPLFGTPGASSNTTSVINRTFLQAANNTTTIGGATNIEFRPLPTTTNNNNNKSPSGLGNTTINPQQFANISGYTAGNAVSNAAGSLLNITTTSTTYNGNVALRLSRTVNNTANFELILPTATANSMLLVDNASGNTLTTYTANGMTVNNVTVASNGFMKLSTYTAAALTAITGAVGWMAGVTDSASGAHPNGMIAFWDTTNSRWSYIHDNSAV